MGLKYSLGWVISKLKLISRLANEKLSNNNKPIARNDLKIEQTNKRTNKRTNKQTNKQTIKQPDTGYCKPDTFIFNFNL